MASDCRKKEGRRVSPYAKCPYYKYESKQMVYCDSSHIVDDSTVHIAFASASPCKSWRHEVCHDYFEGCFIYQNLERFE